MEVFENLNHIWLWAKQNFFDIIDWTLFLVLIYYLYKLVRGTSAVMIFRGIVILIIAYQLITLAEMQVLGTILGAIVGAGVVGLIVVFQPEIRKFLLMFGSNRFTNNKSLWKQFNLFFKISKEQSKLKIEEFLLACDKLKKDKTGAIFVFERNNNLDFVKDDGDTINAELSLPIIESIFYKNSPLHDGAVIIVGNVIVASRVTLPISKNRKIKKSLGLRHKAGIGVTEESDAISVVISEETGKLSYIKNGEIIDYKNGEELEDLISNDLLD